MLLCKCYCHGCGKLFDKQTRGLFYSPLAKQIGDITYPVTGCPECVEAGVIAEAYKRFLDGKSPPLQQEE